MIVDTRTDTVDHVGWLKATSTSTIQETDDLGRTTLTMYGVDFDTVADSDYGFVPPEYAVTDPSLAEPLMEEAFSEDTSEREAELRDPDTKSPWDTTEWYVLDWINYISSAVSPTSPDGTLNIRNRDYEADEAYYPLHQTCIPAWRRAIRGDAIDTDFGFHDVVYDVESASGELLYGTDRDGSWEEMAIGLLYKDPFVVYVESETDASLSGWWMLLSRYRMEWPGEDMPTDAKPESTVGDLVAFWSATSDFREGDVRGPFRLVACTDCVLDGETGEVVEGVRFWIGTAGAAVVTEDSGTSYLYVYYVAEKCTAGLSAVDAHGDAVRMADGTRVDRFDDGVDDALDEVLDTVLTAHSVTQGTWLRKVALADLEAALLDESGHSNEESWQDFPNATPIVAGTVTGRVRIWAVPSWGTESDIQSEFIATTPEKVHDDGSVTAGIEYSVLWADPAPVVLEDQLVLFVAGIYPGGIGASTDDTGGLNLLPYVAVWSCVAVPEAEVGDAYGLYFTVRVPSTVRADGADADDRIATSADESDMYIDPDPVGDIAGVGFVVYVGRGFGGGKTGTLGLYVAESTDVFRAWDSP